MSPNANEHRPPVPERSAGPSDPSLHFRQRHRLTHAREFEAVYTANVRKHRGPVTLFSLPNGRAWPRLGLSIGSRVGPAVQRNRLKRLLREAFRLEQHHLPARADGTRYDLVITCRPHGFWTLAAYRKALRELADSAHAAWERST
ncbi:MAG: ribonuclease P protein component [Phycisphaeraceae bacterium]|nr:ribonuclease P protein component [Phycisphaeraceae bacterium]